MAEPADSSRLTLFGYLAPLIACSPSGAQSLLTLEQAVTRNAGQAGGMAALERGPVVPPAVLGSALAALLVLLAIWYFRDRRAERQRAALSRLYSVGEEMVAGRSPSRNLGMLKSVLPGALRVTDVRLYLYDRGSRILRRVKEDAVPEPVPILTDDPVGLREEAVASCFRNRSLLSIPDTRRSPFFREDTAASQPRAAMFVPMFAEEDLIGVLEVGHAHKVRHFSMDEQAVAQHLANQIALGIKLRERQSMREQMFRNERLAATGQLISSVAAELRAPLETIANSSEALLESRAQSPEGPGLRAISSEARKASKIVTRLLSFTGTAHDDTARVDVASLLSNLLRFRERYWKERQIQVRNLLPPDPVFVEAAPSHLEQVFLSLLLHAEHSIAEAPEKQVAIRASSLAGNVQVELSFSSSPASGSAGSFQEGADPETGALSLDVCRGIVRSHGGELRLDSGPGNIRRFEVVLPAASAPEAAAAAEGVGGTARQPLSTLLVDPDLAAQRQLLMMLSDRGHRVVPVAGPEEALDLVKRFRFHVVLCSVHLSGQSSLEFYESVSDRVDAFVLLSEGHTADLSGSFQQGEVHVLGKPLELPEFLRVIGAVESRLTSRPR
jgi:signal transduction histidine kinase